MMTTQNNQIFIYKLNEDEYSKTSNISNPTYKKCITESNIQADPSCSTGQECVQCCIPTCINGNKRNDNFSTDMFGCRAAFPGFDLPTEVQNPQLRRYWIRNIQQVLSPPTISQSQK